MYETKSDLSDGDIDYHSKAIKIVIWFVLIPILILTKILVMYFSFIPRDNR